MSAEAFETCRQCGGVMERISNENESPLIVECQSCVHREYAEIQISPDDFFTNAEVVYRRVIVHRKGEGAKASEIQALRKLIPDLGNLSVNEAAQRIAASNYFDLGTHSQENARAIVQEAEAEGLKVRLEDPGESTIAEQEKHGFFEPFGAPVTVGEPGEEASIIPAGYILIGLVLIVAVIVWLVL